jgi:serine/threonine protein kinase
VISSAFLQTGFIINNSYKIIKLIGQGGFGRTYLIELITTGEKRVLKEFAPQVSRPEQIAKARDLFNREVGTLRQLNHSQIPHFYELLQTNMGGEEKLFFVQDYIEGNSYHGQILSQIEVINLLQNLLPVLTYIHSQNVIHRDISPDNIIKRNQDNLPILIDFGAVKTAASQMIGSFNPTRIGKNGYVPNEQILRGEAYPSSDLYALGVTCIVLLTGEKPENLYQIDNNNTMIWHWQNRVNVDHNFANILNKMIAENYFHRFQSAQEVLQELNNYNLGVNPLINTNMPTNVTVVAPSLSHQNYAKVIINNISLVIGYIGKLLPKKTNPPPVTIPDPQKTLVVTPQKWKGKTILILMIILFPGIISFALGRGLIKINQNNSERDSVNQCIYNNEKERVNCIKERSSKFYPKFSVFIQEVDKVFHDRHPELKGRPLTDKNTSKERKLREEWFDIAEELLTEKEKG